MTMTEPESLTRNIFGDDNGASRATAIDLALLFGFGTELLYAAGWAYDYRWHARFDIGLNGLGLPVETVLMYGF